MAFEYKYDLKTSIYDQEITLDVHSEKISNACRKLAEDANAVPMIQKETELKTVQAKEEALAKASIDFLVTVMGEETFEKLTSGRILPTDEYVEMAEYLCQEIIKFKLAKAKRYEKLQSSHRLAS